MSCRARRASVPALYSCCILSTVITLLLTRGYTMLLQRQDRVCHRGGVQALTEMQ